MNINRNRFTAFLSGKTIRIICILQALVSLAGCGPSKADLAKVDYSPIPDRDWETSTPEEEGLDPDLVAEMYYKAHELDTIYSLLVIKNGKLVAEDYFNGSFNGDKNLLQSASKSYVSALVGIALEQGCLTSLDQKLIEFFPEYENQIRDERKKEITIRQLLQMRSGYPWEETDPELFEALLVGDNPSLIIDFPLTANPGEKFQYSNATSTWLAAIVSSACDTNLKDFSEEYLLNPIGAEMGEFWENSYNDYHPFYHFSARDAAKFGLLYLNGGEFIGEQVIPAEWVHDSLGTYSEKAWTIRIGKNIKDIGYGYQWWSARSGKHTYNFAWGHGGQLIVLLHDLDMVIVVTADPFWQQHDDTSWKHERANINLVADFIASLPVE